MSHDLRVVDAILLTETPLIPKYLNGGADWTAG